MERNTCRLLAFRLHGKGSQSTDPNGTPGFKTRHTFTDKSNNYTRAGCCSISKGPSSWHRLQWARAQPCASPLWPKTAWGPLLFWHSGCRVKITDQHSFLFLVTMASLALCRTASLWEKRHINHIWNFSRYNPKWSLFSIIQSDAVQERILLGQKCSYLVCWATRVLTTALVNAETVHKLAHTVSSAVQFIQFSSRWYISVSIYTM